MDIMAMAEQLSEGFLVTVEIFALTLLFSLPLGMLVAFGRMSLWFTLDLTICFD